MACMSHDPESGARHEFAASDDSNAEPEPPQPGEARTTNGFADGAADASVDPDGDADRPRQSHDPYQPL